MKSFFKYFFATITAIIFLNVVVIAIIAALGSAADKEVNIDNNSVLKLKFNTPIVDRAVENPFEDFNPVSMESESKLGLNTILKNINKAIKDDKIKGILLTISPAFSQTGMGTVEEIRDALQTFKDSSDKFIISYNEVYDQKTYYLASIADEVYLYPQGIVIFKGLRTSLMFFKNMLEKLEVEMQIIRHGKFKSAVEPFMLEKMSEANRDQVTTFVNTFWNHMLKGIAASRNLTEEELNRVAEGCLIRTAQDAVDYKFVDDLLYEDELIAKLKEKLSLKEDDKINYVSNKKYAKAKEKIDPNKYGKGKIAVIYAQGGIHSGKGDNESIGSETTAAAIRKARKDEKVKAIVLRVNSGGGSALASDVIWREMVLAKETKKVVVSMGDVAASGGYYIACAADKILANEITITGSIGVFGVLPNMKGLLNNKLGLTFDGVKTNQYADMMDISRPLTESERDIIQQSVVNIYDVFTKKVAEGRNMTQAQVDSIGQGRVWAGTDAHRIGLIDEFGGLSKAIETAAELAELDDYRVSEYPKKKDPIEQMIMELTGEKESKILAKNLGESYKYVKYLQELGEMEGIQARIPFYMEVN